MDMMFSQIAWMIPMFPLARVSCFCLLSDARSARLDVLLGIVAIAGLTHPVDCSY